MDFVFVLLEDKNRVRQGNGIIIGFCALFSKEENVIDPYNHDRHGRVPQKFIRFNPSWILRIGPWSSFTLTFICYAPVFTYSKCGPFSISIETFQVSLTSQESKVSSWVKSRILPGKEFGQESSYTTAKGQD